MEFVGQKNLLKTLNGYTFQTLPHTILLLGEDGCGKKTIVKYISNKFGLELIEIDNKVLPENLIDYQHRVVKTLYLIDLSKFALEKAQNQFLKFIEEPSDSVYVVLINTSEVGILPTILNRCQKLRFEPYNINELKQIKQFDNELIYKVCKTPGQLKNIDDKKINELYSLCSTMTHKIQAAPYANMISIAPRINYKEDYTKFDFETFLNMLEYVSITSFIQEQNNTAAKIYLYVSKRRQELLQNSRIQKEPFMINLLDELWKETR